MRAVPLVTAILAVRNESQHIESVLQSLLEQEQSGLELEILVVDGDSSDGTREIIERLRHSTPRIKLLANVHRKAPYAFNLGIQHARGEYVCILGAHTRYAKNYIAACLGELQKRRVAGCSGRLITSPSNSSLQAHLVSWALGHPFGTSRRSVRTQSPGFADTIPYPVFRKDTLLAVGGYDTRLHRNQDIDLSQRLCARGYKLYVTGETSCEYFVSATVRSLMQYAFKTGYWNLISLKQNRRSMAARHLAPFAFVSTLLLFLGLFVGASWLQGSSRFWLRSPLVALVVAYALATLMATMHIAFRERSLSALLLPPVFLGFHLSYGLGTLWAFITCASIPPKRADNFQESRQVFEGHQDH